MFNLPGNRPKIVRTVIVTEGVAVKSVRKEYKIDTQSLYAGFRRT